MRTFIRGWNDNWSCALVTLVRSCTPDEVATIKLPLICACGLRGNSSCGKPRSRLSLLHWSTWPNARRTPHSLAIRTCNTRSQFSLRIGVWHTWKCCAGIPNASAMRSNACVFRHLALVPWLALPIPLTVPCWLKTWASAVQLPIPWMQSATVISWWNRSPLAPCARCTFRAWLKI